MLRKLALLITAGLVATALASPAVATSSARSKDPRVATEAYVRPHGAWTTHYDEDLRKNSPGEPMVFRPRQGDRSIDFEVSDTLGTAVVLHIRQDDKRLAEGHHDYADGVAVCASDYSYELTSLKPVEVRIYTGVCPNHTFGWASRGTVAATFLP